MNKKDYFKNKIVLVTGGVGSIGREIVKRILDYNPSAVRVLDNNESGLFELEQELKSNKLRYFVGDIRDIRRLELALEGVDIVFHAAALKHVPLCEYNPFEAVKTNVIGTQNLIEVAKGKGVERFLTISTDKSVHPINVLGATKLLAERLTISANIFKGGRKTIFSCVRFGNVLASRGSVVIQFLKQISKGGPVTLTDYRMTRFIMDIKQAVDLIIEACMKMKGGEIFILKMLAIRICDLAEVMIEEFAPLWGYSPKDIKIECKGMRPGEKLNEELISVGERKYVVKDGNMYVIMDWTRKVVNDNDVLDESFQSDKCQLLTKEEIRRLLRTTLEIERIKVERMLS